MGHAPESEFLESLKKRLTELENLRLLSPDDLKIVSERRTLRGQIAELERLELAPPQVAAASFIAITPEVEEPSSFFRGTALARGAFPPRLTRDAFVSDSGARRSLVSTTSQFSLHRLLRLLVVR